MTSDDVNVPPQLMAWLRGCGQIAVLLPDCGQVCGAGKSRKPKRGRAFDVLHVAAARLLGADTFISFDGNQRELAGLTVGP